MGDWLRPRLGDWLRPRLGDWLRLRTGCGLSRAAAAGSEAEAAADVAAPSDALGGEAAAAFGGRMGCGLPVVVACGCAAAAALLRTASGEPVALGCGCSDGMTSCGICTPGGGPASASGTSGGSSPPPLLGTSIVAIRRGPTQNQTACGRSKEGTPSTVKRGARCVPLLCMKLLTSFFLLFGGASGDHSSLGGDDGPAPISDGDAGAAVHVAPPQHHPAVQ